MVAQEFIQQLEKMRFVQMVGLDDFADRASYLLSFVFLVLCFTIVTLKSYVFEPLSCYIPTTFSGSGMVSYISAFCWVNGTVPITDNSSLFEDPDYWSNLEANKMNYYQWVSLVLALQAILCYLPRLVWEAITFNRIGTNLSYLIEYAQSASKDSGVDRQRKVNFIANTLDTLLFARRNLKIANNCEIRMRHKLAEWALDLIPRKRLGTALASYYIIVKFLYLFNSIGQLFLIEHFLGSHGKLYGFQAISAMIRGHSWKESLIFPRVGFCRVPLKLPNVPITHVVAQCSLPVNMLNEKIYIFLWFWFCIVSMLEISSICMWAGRLGVRQKRVHNLVKHLKIADAYSDEMTPLIERFELSFLRLDGTFLLHMLRLNAGEIVTHEILQAIIQRFVEEESKKEHRLVINQKATDAGAGFPTTLIRPPDADCLIKKRSEVV